MSPLEAKEYGLIDGVIGGDDAGLKLKGSTKKYATDCQCDTVCLV